MMDKIPSLDELLDYGEEYKFPELIMSDYFMIDPTRQKNNQNNQQNNRQNNSSNQEQTQEQKSEQQTGEQAHDQESEQQTGEQSKEQKQEQQAGEQPQEQKSEQQASEQTQERETEQQTDEQAREQKDEQQNDEQAQEQESEQQADEQAQEQKEEQQADEQAQEQESEQQADEQAQEQEKDDNDFDDLIDNYEEDSKSERSSNQGKGSESPSAKLSDLHATKVYSVFKKLVSLSYDRWQKGTYKYNKKEIVKHYLTNQKFRIMDDLISPTFKPDVYVFDLSPSNDKSLEMYVNAISSVAIKGSIIYLTFNSSVLRKLTIKKEHIKGIDVNQVATSNTQKYAHFDCTVFHEYQSLYEELKTIKDHKIYVFSDFDVSEDMVSLSQVNDEVVWFSTEQKNYGAYSDIFARYFPRDYAGYYVETFGIQDIEKYVLESNKKKYKRRHF